MDAEKKVIDGVFPITTTRAVYIDGTNKTLQDAMDNGEIGNTITTSTSGRGYCITMLRGCEINVYEVPESSSSMGTMAYAFPIGDSDRLRRMYVWTPSGSCKYVEIPDGMLKYCDGLIYNFDTNSLEIRNATWGNVPVSNNEVVLLYNGFNGVVGGVLSVYVKEYNQLNAGIPVYDLEFENIESTGSAQGIFIHDGHLYTWSQSSDDRTSTLGSYKKVSLNNHAQVASGTHNLGHMNSPSYCSERDMLLVGNGSKLYDQTSFPMGGYIYTNFSNVLDANQSNIEHDSLEKVLIDLSQFTGEFKAQLCWGDPSTDYIYLMTCDNRIIRKLQLMKNENGDYTGEYNVVGVWRTTQSNVNGGFKYYNGYLLSGIKGEYGIRKMELCSNGRIKDTYIHPNNKIGDMQGVDVFGEKLYAYTDSRGYSIDISKI